MNKKNVYINTIGCQMNVYDSDQMLKVLQLKNYDPVDSIAIADLIIVNTCAIREKAVQKVYSFLGRLSSLKKKTPPTESRCCRLCCPAAGGKIN